MTILSELEKPVTAEEFNRIAERLMDDPETHTQFDEAVRTMQVEDMNQVTETNVPGLEDQKKDVLAEILAEDPDHDLTINGSEVLADIDMNEGFEEPASTLNEFMSQVAKAKMLRRKHVEATKPVIKHFCRTQYPTNYYFHYQDVMVIEAGRVNEVFEALNGKSREFSI
jgi:hypothetical protein